jgi:hypothetical protein
VIRCDSRWAGRDGRCTRRDGGRTATRVTGRATTAPADRTTRDKRTRHPIRVSPKHTGAGRRRTTGCKGVVVDGGEVHAGGEWGRRERGVARGGRVWRAADGRVTSGTEIVAEEIYSGRLGGRAGGDDRGRQETPSWLFRDGTALVGVEILPGHGRGGQE